MIFSKLLKKEPLSEKQRVMARVDDESSYGEALDSQCQTCRWYHPAQATCEAFPEGVPTLILMGAYDHTYPYADEDLTYEPNLATRINSVVKGSKDQPRIPKGNPGGGEFASEGFSAASFAKKKIDPYAKMSSMDRMKRGYALASKILSKEDYNDFVAKQNELQDDIANGKITAKFYTKDGDEKTYTSERTQVHNDLIKAYFGDTSRFLPEKGKEPTFTIIGGRAGSGKGGLDEKGLKEYDRNKQLVIDSDIVKSMLPDYDPEKAHLFHKEAHYLVTRLLRQARKLHINTVYDSTMSQDDSRVVQTFHRHQFSTRAVFMHVPPYESAGRSLLRWANVGKKKKDGTPDRGRLVNPQICLGMTNNESNFDKTKKHADSWAFYRNDAPSKLVPASLYATEKGVVSDDPKVKKYSKLLTNYT